MGEQGSVQHWCLHSARAVQDQDAHEAGYEGRQARGLRQGGDGEGQAGAEGREGFPCEGPQGQRLNYDMAFVLSARLLPLRPIARGHSAEWVTEAKLAQSSILSALSLARSHVLI